MTEQPKEYIINIEFPRTQEVTEITEDGDGKTQWLSESGTIPEIERAICKFDKCEVIVRSRPHPAPAPAQSLDEIWRGCPDLRSNESGDALCAMYGECSFPNCHMSGLAVRKSPAERDAAIARAAREKMLKKLAEDLDVKEQMFDDGELYFLSKEVNSIIESLREQEGYSR